MTTLAQLLLCAAHTEDWEAWDTHKNALAPLLTRTRLVDSHVAGALEASAELASLVGESVRALEVYGLAHSQWRTLRKLERASQTQERITALEP